MVAPHEGEGLQAAKVGRAFHPLLLCKPLLSGAVLLRTLSTRNVRATARRHGERIPGMERTCIGILGRSERVRPGSGLRARTETSKAWTHIAASAVSPARQPTIRRANRSSMATRYSNLSAVQIAVMSETHTRFGTSCENCRARMLDCFGCFGSVVIAVLSRRRDRAQSAFARMILATRFLVTCLPSSEVKSLRTRGLP